ncbi:hypothetical protein ACVOMV_06950 [Mesorhizobium atlanticum]
MAAKVDGKKIVWPVYVLDHMVGAVASTIARLRFHGIEGPWIAMATLTGVKDYSLVLGGGNSVGPAWQDLAYLGEIVDDVMTDGALGPLTEGVWRVFGVDRPPKLQR